MVNAIENLMLVAIFCAEHSLNLAVQYALAVKGVKTALARVKKTQSGVPRANLCVACDSANGACEK